jgi:hypothetical protein
MCIQHTTIFKTCGCRVVELYARCAYYEDNFSECMNWTEVHDMPEQPGKCLKRDCKSPNAQPPAEIKELAFLFRVEERRVY